MIEVPMVPFPLVLAALGVGFAVGLAGYASARRHAYRAYLAAHQRARENSYVFCADCRSEDEAHCVCREGFYPVTPLAPPVNFSALDLRQVLPS